jgi:serine protease AprX
VERKEGSNMLGKICVSWLSVSACLAGLAGAQAVGTAEGVSEGPVWVFFTDKGYESEMAENAAIDALSTTYNERAIWRRQLRRTAPGLFDARDLPVNSAYTQDIEGLGGEVRISSKWLNAISIEAGPDAIAAISSLDFVDRVEPVRHAPRTEPVKSEPVDGGGTTRSFYGLADGQLSQISLIELHGQGYTGEGVIIGILDTGFYRGHEAFNHPDNPVQVVAEWDFINNDGNTANEGGDDSGQHSHGTMILGTIRAYNPDTLVGGAYNASVILCKTEDITSETQVEEDYYVAGLEFIEANGGDLATSSLSYSAWYNQSDYDGQTAVTTIGVNIATANGVHCCTSVGNGGHDSDPNTSHLGAPADAYEVLAIGAVTSEGSTSGFSSDGPTADGRVKPELLAQGSSTYTVDPYDNNDYRTASGTSLSAPLAAAAVACLVQARPWWTPAQMREHLFNTASDFVQNGEYDPMYVRGYGILHAANALADDCTADVNGDGEVNTQDVLAFLNLWVADEDQADFNGDGTINTQDVLAFLNAWVAGC